MATYFAPQWMKNRGISDAEYRAWLTSQTDAIWERELKKKKSGCPTPTILKGKLDSAVHRSNGHDPYSGMKLNVDRIRADWFDTAKDIEGTRHHRTLRRAMVSFDHVKGMGKSEYELCSRETNSAKAYLSPKQFIELCRKVAKRHP